MLREVAQCPPEDMDKFQDIELYQYFNTNNLWIDLKALQWMLISGEGMLTLPLIINPKIVDDTPVYQLETAMGAAISVFNNSKALVVPRQRFAPVKKTNDLLTIWSGSTTILNDQYQLILKRGLSCRAKDRAGRIDIMRAWSRCNQDLQPYHRSIPVKNSSV
jgi:UTP--glucose-1-phosphate uridylyltransferase